jgi:hypothetical protein
MCGHSGTEERIGARLFAGGFFSTARLSVSMATPANIATGTRTRRQRVALPGAAPFAKVFQVAVTAGILAYCFSFIPAAFIDGIVCGLITGAIFLWRWPY